MATRRKPSITIAEDKNVRSSTLIDFAWKSMKKYSVEVNLDRAIPSYKDGLKPVQRRLMWALYLATSAGNPIKTARVVGDTMGKFHPHGNSSLESAAATMVQAPSAMLHGVGNWGSMIDGAAAMRYTLVGLSHYGQTFFDKHYIHKNVTKLVPNYDDHDVEPVDLPALLPNVLLNGGEGIGVGVTCRIPTFTPDSLCSVVLRLLSGEKLEPIDFAKALKFNHRWGGVMTKTKANRQALLAFMKDTNGSIYFESDVKVDRDHKRIILDDYPPGVNLDNFINRIRALPTVETAYNSKGTTTYTVQVKKALNYNEFDAVVEKIRTMSRVRRNFQINLVDQKDTGESELFSCSVPQLIVKWIRWRIDLEIRSLKHRIEVQESEIAYSKLLIYACDKLDVIFKALKTRTPHENVQKGLKISAEQAKQILDLRVIQLSRLDQDALKEKLKGQQSHLKQLNLWLKAPKKKIRGDIESLIPAFAKDIQRREEAKTKKLSVSHG